MSRGEPFVSGSDVTSISRSTFCSQDVILVATQLQIEEALRETKES